MSNGLAPVNARTEDLFDSVAEASGRELTLVSRLDHPTSGVLPMALGPEGSVAANWLQAQFAARLVLKEYLCLVEGCSVGRVGSTAKINAPLQTIKRRDQLRTEVSSLGREAVTEYEVLARYDAGASTNRTLSLLVARPRTGRTHQIRVHMASIGAPIVGDLTYGMKHDSAVPSCGRLFLHCRRIKCKDLKKNDFEAEAALPPELLEVLRQLQKVE
ncbi:truC [Symbiodinium pilosum]|uniref:TruC protein n=1 Tax=Symbiodinium pilosum TaxID=2952 RepID=A0A812VXE8_SYMPI|nr:truC [Symbiodinium pilosum]